MDWQERYESGDTPWDKGLAAPSIFQFLAEKPLLFFEGSHVAVPGCGYGHDSVFLAREGCSVVGFDIAPVAVEEARRRAPSELDLEYQVADLFEYCGPLIGSFDLIWEHTCFCALNPSLRESYVQSMWRFLKPGGHLAGVFFIDSEADPADGPPFMSTLESVKSVFNKYFTLEWQSDPRSSYEGREGREQLLLFKRIDS